MANSMHELEIIGNLGRDPEMRVTNSGQPVTNFSVASTRTWNNAAGEKQEETIWFRITTWGKQAEACNQYLRKGAKVRVAGRLIPGEGGGPRIWKGDDGTPHASFEVNASDVMFLSSRNGEGGGSAPAEEQGDEIPF